MPANRIRNNAPRQPAPQAPVRAVKSDDKVWVYHFGDDAYVGKGAARRPVNTADKKTSKAIDGWERTRLLKMAMKDPQKFLQALRDDSANGSEVGYDFVKQIGKYGIGRIEFRAKDGEFSTTASIEIFNKAVDEHLKAYMAKDAREKNVRSSVALTITGSLTEAGGLENVGAEVSAHNVPKFSAEKIMELDKITKELKAALKSDAPDKEKSEDVMRLFGKAMERMADFPLPFFMNLIDSRQELQITIKEKGKKGPVARATVGAGRYAVTFSEILGGDKDEPKLKAILAGSANEDDGVFSIDKAKIGAQDKIAIEFDEDKRPHAYKMGKNGEKLPVNDHLGEIMMYLPLALALAGGQDIF